MPKFSLKWLFAAPVIVGLSYVGGLASMVWLLLISVFLLLKPRPFTIGFAFTMWLYTFAAGHHVISAIRLTRMPENKEERVAYDAYERYFFRLLGMHSVGMLGAGLAGGSFLHWAANRDAPDR